MIVFVKVKIRNVTRFVKLHQDDLQVENLNKFFEKVFAEHEIDEEESDAIDFNLFEKESKTPIKHQDLLPLVMQYRFSASFCIEIRLTEQCQRIVKISAEVRKIYLNIYALNKLKKKQ